MENKVKAEKDTVEILQKRVKLQREIMEKFREEIVKRDKILENVMAGGDVTFTNPETNTFELYIKQIPFKVEKVTLNSINWDELMNSVEKVDNISYAQDQDQNLSQNANQNSGERKRRSSASNQNITKTTFFPAEKQVKKEMTEIDSIIKNESGNGRIFLPLEELNTLQYFKKGKSFLSSHGQLLSRILQGNQESLVKLILEPNSNPNTTLIIPRLQNVKIIQFDFDTMDFPAFFPYGFHVNFTFPKLEQVVMNFLTGAELQPKSKSKSKAKSKAKSSGISPGFLCYGEPFETVESLTLAQVIPPASSLRKIRAMFPRLTKLQLNNSLHDVALFLPLVFHHFPRLHQLILEIDTDTRRGNLDSALSGLSVDLCKKLELELEKKVPCLLDPKEKENNPEIGIKFFTSGPNLSDLKDLKLLKFVLCPAEQGAFESTKIPVPVMTPVAFEYGLGKDQLEKLDILLDFHCLHEENTAILTCLRPVFPYFTTISTN